VTIYIICFLLLGLIPIVFGVGYFARVASRRRTRVRGPEVRNGTPVTLDRSPDMPKMPGATS